MSRDQAIHALDPTTVRQIHSGQVIVSIESIVKELIENALDAAATSIEVRIVNNGLTLIQVKDDGYGIDTSSRALVGQRHHTSKIASMDDLNRIHTFGFRGEAISSMCAVSAKIELTTKTADDRLAMRYELDRSGTQISETPTGLIARSGTIISVSEPFTYLPVRRQVIEKSFSFKRLQELLTKYALTHPYVRLSIVSASTDSRRKEIKWVKPAASDIIHAIAFAYNRQLASMVEYHRTADEAGRLIIECVLPKPKSDPAVVYRGEHVHVNVNQRPVSYPRCELKEAVALVRKKYNPDESSRKTPFMYINIQLDGDQFDVNVEPNKSAVLFHHKQQVLDLFEALVCQVYISPPDGLIGNQLSDAPPSPPEPHMESDTGMTSPVADMDASIQLPPHASGNPSPVASHGELAASPLPGRQNNEDEEQGPGPSLQNDQDENLGAWKFSMGSQDTSTSSEEEDQLIPSDHDEDLHVTQENSGPRVPTLSEWLQRPNQKPVPEALSAQPVRKEQTLQSVGKKQSQQPVQAPQYRRATSSTTRTSRNNTVRQPSRGQDRTAVSTPQTTSDHGVQQTTSEEFQWQIENDQPLLSPRRSTPVPLQERDRNIPQSSPPQQKSTNLYDVFRMQKSTSTPVSTGKGKGRAQPVVAPTKSLPTKRKHDKLLVDTPKNQSATLIRNFEMPVKSCPSSILTNYPAQRKRHGRFYRVRMDRYPCAEGSEDQVRCFPLWNDGNKVLDVYVKTRKQGCNVNMEEVGVMVRHRMKYACSLSWYLEHHALTPDKELKNPIKIEISKEDPYFRVIASLKKNETAQIDYDGNERLFKVVNDRRIVSNGFQCRWRMMDRVTMLLQITAIHTLGVDYGVADFRELLSILHEYPWIDNLSHCRPRKVEDYYRDLLSLDTSSTPKDHAFSDDVLQWESYVTESETYQVGVSDLLEDNPIVCCALFRVE
ncbi:hypothetical protein BJV82DRAFT_566140 [Fennellomyces sp. T-0311]|nr:hypothetical protein BJV82DRAFT_566140 [Fennellomyces sp. T-0311]